MYPIIGGDAKVKNIEKGRVFEAFGVFLVKSIVINDVSYHPKIENIKKHTVFLAFWALLEGDAQKTM